jgi:type IV secretion system protein TrbE
MRELMAIYGKNWPFEWLKQKGIDHDFIKEAVA